MDDETTPFPRPDMTPPVTKIYFVDSACISMMDLRSFYFLFCDGGFL